MIRKKQWNLNKKTHHIFLNLKNLSFVMVVKV